MLARSSALSMLLLGLVSVNSESLPLHKDVYYANVILQGATGNLAGKYLWRAMFSLYLGELGSTEINFIGAGRDPKEKGEGKVNDFLETRVNCDDIPYGCEPEDIPAFKSTVSYEQLKTAEHYRTLCAKLEEDAANGKPEMGRIFYLSVPPFAYAEITKMIKDECTPKTEGAWLRVAFEKPFGSDLESAKEMAAVMAANLEEDQIYRFDHYLGKVGVQQIADFRVVNAEAYDELWNGKHIERVEIFMTETEDCKGRTGFYDEYGVVRDIHQNHLMELFALVAVDTLSTEDSSPAEMLKAKAKVISEVKEIQSNYSMIGQYIGYKQHVKDDRKDDHDSKTPTFAVFRMEVDNEMWKNTSFVLMAGKMLEKREAGVTVHFRNGEAIHFHIQGGDPKHGPHFYKTKNLPKVMLPDPDWEPDFNAPKMKDQGAGKPKYTSSFSIGPEPDLPYNRLVRDMFQGNQANFVGTEGLMASWRAYDSFLKEIADVEPTLYPPGLKPDYFTHVFAHQEAGIAKSFGEAVFEHHTKEHIEEHSEF